MVVSQYKFPLKVVITFRWLWLWQGMHLDPSIYLMDEENKSPSAARANEEGENSLKVDNKNKTLSDFTAVTDSHCNIKDRNSENVSSMQGVSADELNKVTAALKSLFPEIKGQNLLFILWMCSSSSLSVPFFLVWDLADWNCSDCFPDCADEADKGSTVDKNPGGRKEKYGAQPIVVPIVLKMAEFDHEVLPKLFSFHSPGYTTITNWKFSSPPLLEYERSGISSMNLCFSKLVLFFFVKLTHFQPHTIWWFYQSWSSYAGVTWGVDS